MEAVIARLAQEIEPKTCSIEDCHKDAAFYVVKMKDDGSETEKYFCETHGEEYALRGHLVISGND